MAFNKVVTAKSTQTVLDLSLQLKGSVEKVFELISENTNIENLESDVTGLDVSYDVNNTAVQKYYIANNVSVSAKPVVYLNSTNLALIVGDDAYLIQENDYKILL